MNMSQQRPFRTAVRRTQSGFTLVEMVIVVLIIGVLAAIAYPAYQNSVVKTRRNAAKACLSEASSFMERFYTTSTLSYVGGDAAWPGCAAGTDVTNHYTVAIAVADARSYTITATPRGLQLAKDTDCGAMSLNNIGTKTVTGSKSVDYCW
jgi:type IV pilus assembly protein PilE